MRASALAIGLILGLGLTACAVGPTYVSPRSTPAESATFLSTTLPDTEGGDARDDWWQLYDDPTLNSLLRQALARNTDVRVAVGRLEKARAALRAYRVRETPETQVAGSATRQRYPDWQVLPGAPQEFDSVDLGLSVAYELDLFGHVRRGVEAARADTDAAAADLDAVRVEVVAETTRAYLDLGADGERLNAAVDALSLVERSLDVTTARYEAGRAEHLDVLRLAALRDQRNAVLIAAKSQRESDLFRLAILLGLAPRDLPRNVMSLNSLPGLSTSLPVGDGARLLARRPDVRVAERRLAAATARVGVATSDLYPRISLGGGIGVTSDSLASGFTDGALRYTVGPGIQWAFPNLAGVEARILSSKADVKIALATYDGAVLRALNETEAAISAYDLANQNHQALARAYAEAKHAADVALNRQRAGELDFLSLLDAERTAAAAQSDLADADARVVGTQIDLFKALGGGWRTAAALASNDH